MERKSNKIELQQVTVRESNHPPRRHHQIQEFLTSNDQFKENI